MEKRKLVEVSLRLSQVIVLNRELANDRDGFNLLPLTMEQKFVLSKIQLKCQEDTENFNRLDRELVMKLGTPDGKGGVSISRDVTSPERIQYNARIEELLKAETILEVPKITIDEFLKIEIPVLERVLSEYDNDGKVLRSETVKYSPNYPQLFNLIELMDESK